MASLDTSSSSASCTWVRPWAQAGQALAEGGEEGAFFLGDGRGVSLDVEVLYTVSPGVALASSTR